MQFLFLEKKLRVNNAAKKATEKILAQKNDDETKIQARESQEQSGELDLFDKVLDTLKTKVVSDTFKHLNNEQNAQKQLQQEKSHKELEDLRKQLTHNEQSEFSYEYKK